MERDARKLFRLTGERHLLVLLPEEAGVGQARGQNLAVARDDRRAAISGGDIGGADKGIGQLAGGIAADEILLVHPRGQLDHFGRHVEERLVKAAEQRLGPFGETGVFDDQAFIVHQHKAGSLRRGARLVAHDGFALGMVDDHVGFAQAGGIIGRAGDGDVTLVMEAVPARDRARADAAHFQVDRLLAQDGDDARERAHPAQGFRAERGGAPALRLGPGKRADDRRDGLGQHVLGRAAGLFGDRKQHAITLGQLLAGQPGLAQEAFQGLRRGGGARPLHFLADSLRAQRQIARDQCQPARR